MDGIQANHNMHAMAPRRNTAAALSLESSASASVPPSKRYLPEIGKGTRFTITIGTAILLASAIWVAATWVMGLTRALEENTKAVKELSSTVWTIQDSVDFAYKFSVANPSVTVPSPKSVVAERIRP